jgi:voltage-dependent potassium channel beta subunit
MEYRHLGPTGLLVSALSYGNMLTFEQVGVDGSLEIMKYLVDNGVNFYDTAEVYGKGEAERILGIVLQKGIEKGYWKRSDLVISTKLYWGATPHDIIKTFPNNVGLSRKHIIEGITASLKRLQLDYVDVVFCHRPDDHTPLEETVKAMNWIIDQGKAFYWGTSEWPAEKIREAIEIASRLGLHAPVVEQPEYSILKRNRFEVEYAPLYENPGLGTTVWGALASGILTGKYDAGTPEDSRLAIYPMKELLYENPKSPSYQGSVARMVDLTQKLEEVAKEIGCTTAQLALAWVLKNKNTSTIVMGGKLKYLKENLGALKVVDKLTTDVLEKLEGIVNNAPLKPMNWRNAF